MGSKSSSLQQSLSQYGTSYAQPAVAPSVVAPLPRQQHISSFRPGNPSDSNSQPDSLVGSKSAQDGSRAGPKHLDSLPDISAEELPLKYVDRQKLQFSAERLKVRLLPSCLNLHAVKIPNSASGRANLCSV